MKKCTLKVKKIDQISSFTLYKLRSKTFPVLICFRCRLTVSGSNISVLLCAFPLSLSFRAQLSVSGWRMRTRSVHDKQLGGWWNSVASGMVNCVLCFGRSDVSSFFYRNIQRNMRATGCQHCFSIVIYPPDFLWFGFHSRSNDNYEFSTLLCLASNWNQFDSRVFQNWSINWKARFVPNNEMLQTK